MEETRRVAEAPGFPPRLFFHQASVEAGQLFFDERAPGARAISDPEGVLYEAFGLRRGSLLALFGPSVWLRGLRALTKGHRIGARAGDVLRMPGAFFVRGRHILWHHRARHAGDLPDLAELQKVLVS